MPKVETVVRHAVGMYLGHVELVAAQLRYLNIGGEDGNHEEDAVAFVQKKVFLQGVEDIAHSSGAAFGGEEVVSAAWRTVITHFLRQIVLYQYLGEV